MKRGENKLLRTIEKLNTGFLEAVSYSECFQGTIDRKMWKITPRYPTPKIRSHERTPAGTESNSLYLRRIRKEIARKF